MGWLSDYLPDAGKAFQSFRKEILSDGALATKDKALIALVCASVLRDARGVKMGVETAKNEGCSSNDIASALAVAWNTCGATQIYWAQEKLEELIGTKWYKKHIPKAGTAFAAFHAEIFEKSPLERKLVELIAFAVSCIMRCKHCLEAHAVQARDAGASDADLSEAIGVAWLLGSGSQISWIDFGELLKD